MTDAERFLSISWPAPSDAEPDYAALPETRAVAIFEDDTGRASLIATCANLRALARRRLAPSDAPPARAVNLRAITRAVHAAPTGSAFESDLIYLELIRERLAHVYRSVTDRWRGWFVGVDPDEPFPRFARASTGDMAGADPNRTFLGPVADKHAGARLIELLENAFDLCRYHHILVQAPDATACVYKEMGKCPAPCDGSETMETYRARLRDAIAFAQDPAPAIERAEREMRAEAEAMAFERAETRRKWIEHAREATRAKFRNVRDLSRFRLLAVAPGQRDGWARLFAIGAGRWTTLADVARDRPEPDMATLARAALDRLAPPRLNPPPLTHDDMDRLGLICAWLARPEKNRRGVRFIWDDDNLEPALLDALRHHTDDTSDDEPPHEITPETQPETQSETQPDTEETRHP